MSVHKFTEMTIMLLTLRLDSASRPCTELSQHPSSLSLSPLTFRAGTNSRAPGMLVKQTGTNLPFLLHSSAARPPGDSHTGPELAL